MTKEEISWRKFDDIDMEDDSNDNFKIMLTDRGEVDDVEIWGEVSDTYSESDDDGKINYHKHFRDFCF